MGSVGGLPRQRLEQAERNEQEQEYEERGKHKRHGPGVVAGMIDGSTTVGCEDDEAEPMSRRSGRRDLKCMPAWFHREVRSVGMVPVAL